MFTSGTQLYRYVVHDTKTYNLTANYRFSTESRNFRDTTIQTRVNNVLNAQPPLVSGGSQGYEITLYTQMARGRTYSLELKRRL